MTDAPDKVTIPTDETLLPCPAGHVSGRVIGGPKTAGGAKYWTGCDDCSWRAGGDTEAEAIKAWNTRQSTSPVEVERRVSPYRSHAEAWNGALEKAAQIVERYNAIWVDPQCGHAPADIRLLKRDIPTATLTQPVAGDADAAHGLREAPEHWVVHGKRASGVHTSQTLCGQDFRFPLKGTNYLAGRVNCPECITAALSQSSSTVETSTEVEDATVTLNETANPLNGTVLSEEVVERVFAENINEQANRLNVHAEIGESPGHWRDRVRRAAINALSAVPRQ